VRNLKGGSGLSLVDGFGRGVEFRSL